MTTYTFSVVGTNSIGSGEDGVLNYTTPGELNMICVRMCIKYSTTLIQRRTRMLK